MSALSAANLGASVLVVEKGGLWGGTSAKSGGGLWVPNNRNISRAGVSDSSEEAFEYMRGVIPAGEVDDATIMNYIEYSLKMLNFLEAQTELSYTPIPGYADYYPGVEGWKPGGRTVDPSSVDGRKLGEMLYKLVDSPPASKALSVFSMSVSEAVQILTRMPGWKRTCLRVFWGYLTDIPGRLKGRRDRHLAQGNALLSALYLSCKAKGVELVLETPVVSLVESGGRVNGIVVEGGKRIAAGKGVVIAAGGFEHNQETREANLPMPTSAASSSGVETNTGDLIAAAEKLGATTGMMHDAWWTPTVMTPSGPAVLFSEKSKPGLIIVDKMGQRFMNESITYNSYGDCFYRACKEGKDVFPAYCIFDSHYRKKYMFAGLVQAELSPDFMNRAMIGEGKMLIKARSIKEISQKIGVDYEGLKSTMTKVRTYAEAGVDQDFGRGGDDHDVMYGDPEVKPNACLGPMTEGPYYAAELLLGDLGTKGGLEINHDGQVMNEKGGVIDGLYAVGNSTSSIMGSKYPGAGCTLGPAMAIGFKAGHHAMGKPI